MSNLLIVESKNDKYFIEALLKHMKLDIEVGIPVCAIDEFECLGGIGKLEEKLRSLSRRVQKESIDKIGIIFDADKVGVKERTQEIEDKIKLIFGETPDVKFNIYIMNIGGEGELEDILKEIKTKDSTFADCLESWKECLEQNEKTISDKDFNKFWVNNYIKYDTCTSSRHRGNKNKYCNNKFALKEKNIWNFDHEILNELKEFLKEVGE